MKRVARTLGLVTAVALAVTAGAAVADPTNAPGYGPSGLGMMGWGMGPMMGGGPRGMWGGGPMMGGFFPPADALRSELAIKPTQEEAWATYAKVLTDTVQSIQASHQGADFAALRAMSFEDRQNFMLQRRSERQAQFDALFSAGKTLFAALDDDQKLTAAKILPVLSARGPGYGRGWGPH